MITVPKHIPYFNFTSRFAIVSNEYSLWTSVVKRCEEWCELGSTNLWSVTLATLYSLLIRRKVDMADAVKIC
jgi:hypothetical protein